MWTGADGDGKTFLAQTMAVAIATGKEFLGMTCQQAPVLFIDLENPAHVVQARMRILAEDESLDKLKIWGAVELSGATQSERRHAATDR